MNDEKTAGSRLGAVLQAVGVLLCLVYLANRLFDFGLEGLPGQVVRNVVIPGVVLLVAGNVVQRKTRRGSSQEEAHDRDL